jgi:hypothetical protein
MHARHPRRRLKALVSIAFMTALVAGTTASVGAFGSLGTSGFPTPNLGGWVPFSQVSGSFTFDVDGFAHDPIDNGDYSERITSITCIGDGAVVTSGSSMPALGPTAGVSVTITGDTDFSGTLVQCAAQYERFYFDDCHHSIFGDFCNIEGPWVPAGTAINQRVFKLDASAPTNLTIHPSSAPNANGWYRTPGTVNWSASDPHSAIVSCTSASFGGSDGQFGIQGKCRNGAGLESSSFFVYNYDATQPNLAPTVTPSSVALNGSATAVPHATDPFPGSGIDTASCDPVDTSTVGTHTVSCTATDKAGNSRTASASYTVGYVASDFSAPVDPDAMNVANSGQGIPLKWRVTDANGAPITDLASVAVSATSLTCDLDITADQIEEYSAGLAGLQNLGNGYYQYNWKTPKTYAKSCKTLHLDLGNDVEISAAFRFAK